METTNLRRGVAGALAATGALHLILAPEYLSEQAYIGALFIAGGLAAIVLAAILWNRSDGRVAALGVTIAVGMGAGFVLSRTTGLPGFHESEWEFSGLLSLALEAFVAGAAWQLLRSRPFGGRRTVVR